MTQVVSPSTTEKVSLRHIVLPNDVIGVGSVINLDGVNVNNTVLDPKFQKHGGYIDFGGYSLYDNWKRVIKGIRVPALPVTYEMDSKFIAVLHPIAMRANIVARMLHEVQIGEKTFTNLQKAVHAYFVELTNTIFGKGGVFNRWILGPRLKKSFRAVVIPGRYDRDFLGESYEWVGIPQKICTKLKIKEGDIVCIGRDPTIWMGSLEFLYAYPVAHDAIEIHPILLPQFGGDHDGDQLWGYVPNPDSIPEGSVASFTREFATWSKNFNQGQETNKIDFSKFAQDQENRIKTTGLSVSPSDILTSSSDLQSVMDYCSKASRTRGKSDNTELISIANQIPIKEWKEYTESINRAQLAMKVFMGPVGLLALRLIVIGHDKPEIRISANILAERCAQGLLDAKHLTREQAANFKPAQLFEILNLNIPELKSGRAILEAIQKIVPCDDRVLPFLDFLVADKRGVANLSRQEYPLFEGITSTASMDANGYMPAFVLSGDSHDEGIISHAFAEGLKT